MILKNYTINKIHGPVSMNILTSKNIDIIIPPIILFGDIHIETQENENISSQITDNINYNITSEKFISILNEVAKNDNNVDIYIEQKFLYEKNDFKNDKYNDFNRDLISNEKTNQTLLEIISNHNECFLNNLKNNDRDKYNIQCKYNNIRWHLSDARNFFDPNINKWFQYRYIESIMVNIQRCLIFIRDDLKHDNNLIKKSLLLDIFIKNYKNIYKIKIEINDDDLMNIKKSLENVRFFFENKSKDHVVNNFIKSFVLNNYYIIKQMKYFDNELKKLFEQSFYKYCEYIYDNCYNMYIIEDSNFMLKIINTFIKIIDEKLNGEFIDEFIELNINRNLNFDTYKYQIKSLFTILLDLYYILRMLKMNANKSTLHIGYFGAYHVKNISYYLDEILNTHKIFYEQKYDPKNINRLISIDKNINFNKMIEKISNNNLLDEINIEINYINSLKKILKNDEYNGSSTNISQQKINKNNNKNNKNKNKKGGFYDKYIQYKNRYIDLKKYQPARINI